MPMPERLFEKEGQEDRKKSDIKKRIQFQSHLFDNNHRSQKKNHDAVTKHTLFEERWSPETLQFQFTVNQVDQSEGRVHRTDPTAIETPEEDRQNRGKAEYDNPELKLVLHEQNHKECDRGYFNDSSENAVPSLFGHIASGNLRLLQRGGI